MKTELLAELYLCMLQFTLVEMPSHIFKTKNTIIALGIKEILFLYFLILGYHQDVPVFRNFRV